MIYTMADVYDNSLSNLILENYSQLPLGNLETFNKDTAKSVVIDSFRRERLPILFDTWEEGEFLKQLSIDNKYKGLLVINISRSRIKHTQLVRKLCLYYRIT